MSAVAWQERHEGFSGQTLAVALGDWVTPKTCIRDRAPVFQSCFQ